MTTEVRQALTLPGCELNTAKKSQADRWCKPTGVSINQPAAVVSNSPPTRRASLKVIADHHTR